MTLAELAQALAGVPGYALPAHVEPGLESHTHFSPSGLTYGNATHAVEVDVSAGHRRDGHAAVTWWSTTAARMINPTLVEGQIHGGVVHGIGNALFERMVFDEDAQPLTTNFGDYLLPTITEVPPIEIAHIESPSPLNPLGVKGRRRVRRRAGCGRDRIRDRRRAFALGCAHQRVSGHPDARRRVDQDRPKNPRSQPAEAAAQHPEQQGDGRDRWAVAGARPAPSAP